MEELEFIDTYRDHPDYTKFVDILGEESTLQVFARIHKHMLADGKNALPAAGVMEYVPQINAVSYHYHIGSRTIVHAVTATPPYTEIEDTDTPKPRAESDPP